MTSGNDHVTNAELGQVEKRIEEHFRSIEGLIDGSRRHLQTMIQGVAEAQDFTNGKVGELVKWKEQMIGRGQVIVFLVAVFGATMLAFWLANRVEPKPGAISCASFRFQSEAQAYYDTTPGDPFNLDGDGDRVPCEGLP